MDAGPESKTRATSYEVETEYLLEAVDEIARFKGEGVECHIDSPGEPMMYRHLPELVAGLKAIGCVTAVSLQTNGTLLTSATIAALESSGLDRINLSLHALDPDLARMLAGVDWFDIAQVSEAARAVAKSRIDLLIAPVYIPGINDAEIPKLIRFAQECGAGKRFPPLGIQKFEHYRVRPEPERGEGPELVAVLQPEHPAVGEGAWPPAPARHGAGLWHHEAPVRPAHHGQGREGHGRDPGAGLDPRRDAGRGKEPRGLGL